MRTLPGSQIHVRRYVPEEAAEVIEHARKWQQEFRRERGETFFYLGDEFYLMTGMNVPGAAMYDGFPQIEDGIGITRHLLDDVDRLIRRTKRGALQGSPGVVACGTLIGPTMETIVGRLNQECGTELQLAVIENTFFGPEINVSGLLTGSDLVTQLNEEVAGRPVYISTRTISDRTHTMLDDMTVGEVGDRLAVPVVPALTFTDVARDMRSRRTARSAA
jgi:NifB/MoaA-like Fe-S oxidoreductase